MIPLQSDDINEFISIISTRPKILKQRYIQIYTTRYHDLFSSFDESIFHSPLTLLDFCCFFGSLNCFKYLLLNKSIITKKSLNYAIAGGNLEIINILKERGESFDMCLETSIIFHRYILTDWIIQNYKSNPISYSTCIKYFNYEALLYAIKIDQSRIFPGVLSYTLIDACSSGNNRVVQYLVNKGADVNYVNRGRSPLISACHSRNLNLIEYLVELGADVGKTDQIKNTPLHIACFYNCLSIVKFLIEKAPANIEAKNESGQMPLHVACSHNQYQIVKYLISISKIDINARDNDGMTALHIAALNHNTEIVLALISAKANKNIKDNQGKTPFDLGNKTIKEILA